MGLAHLFHFTRHFRAGLSHGAATRLNARPFKTVHETSSYFKSKLFCPVTSVTLPPNRRAGYFQEGFPQAFAFAFP
jgi:hypothetical protein